MPDPKEIKLTTTFKNGKECVDRDPPTIHERRKDVDVVRITNDNPPIVGSSITVTLDSKTLGRLFVSPPAGPQELEPQKSLDLIVKPVIPVKDSEGFTTDPQSCHQHDSGDIIIEP